MRNYIRLAISIQGGTFKHESLMLIMCKGSHVSQPLTAQVYEFELNQSRSFKENMDPSFARTALAFSACFAATQLVSHPI